MGPDPSRHKEYANNLVKEKKLDQLRRETEEAKGRDSKVEKVVALILVVCNFRSRRPKSNFVADKTRCPATLCKMQVNNFTKNGSRFTIKICKQFQHSLSNLLWTECTGGCHRLFHNKCVGITKRKEPEHEWECSECNTAKKSRRS